MDTTQTVPMINLFIVLGIYAITTFVLMVFATKFKNESLDWKFKAVRAVETGKSNIINECNMLHIGLIRKHDDMLAAIGLPHVQRTQFLVHAIEYYEKNRKFYDYEKST